MVKERYFMSNFLFGSQMVTRKGTDPIDPPPNPPDPPPKPKMC